jgi:hypothetical protein
VLVQTNDAGRAVAKSITLEEIYHSLGNGGGGDETVKCVLGV